METPPEVQIWISELKGAIGSPPTSTGREYWCEGELERNPYIFEATHVTAEEEALRCFKPSLVTIGPLYFDLSNQVYRKGNALKMEALRFIAQAPEASHAPWRLRDGETWENVFESIVTWIVSVESNIKSCYKEATVYLTGRTFGWMNLVDACFVLVALHIFNGNGASLEPHWGKLQVLSSGLEDATLRMIVEDMIKLDNQLPTRLLKEVAHMLHIENFPSYLGFVKKIGNKLSDEVINRSLDDALQSGEGHLLYLVRAAVFRRPGVREEEDVDFTVDSISDIMVIYAGLCCFPCCCSYWCLHSLVLCDFEENEKSKWDSHLKIMGCLNIGSYFVHLKESITYGGAAVFAGMLLVILFPLLVIPVAVLATILLIPSFIIAYFWPNHNLTSGRLRPVSFLMYYQFRNTRDPIQLYVRRRNLFPLPYIPKEGVWDVVLRNVIALERCSPDLGKTVSYYACLMSEILEMPQDVATLQEAGVIPRWVTNSREIERWRSLATSAKVHGAPYVDNNDPISVIRIELLSPGQLSRFMRMWWTWKLWLVELRKMSASSPWIALSTAAAIALLLMTGAQVICLFVSSNHK